ncbi:putative cyclase-domain-containing protein, partial [Ilyonectria destructans]
YPDFDSLPVADGQPQGSAWGFWGPHDELGSLNYLTPDVVKEAAKEIKAGVSVQLDLRLDTFNDRVAGRQGFTHEIVDFKERLRGHPMYDFYAHDDVLTFNTQSSSQWDGFRHVAIQESATYYNGMKHREIDEKRDEGRLGIHRKGGIVGRGVLLDYLAWRQKTGQTRAKANSSVAITTDELDAVAEHQGTELRVGDILIIRTGFTEWHLQATQEDRLASMSKGAFIGVEASMKSVKWLWNHHFAAVAGDTLGFECTPIAFTTQGQVRLHDWLLAYWATPIGELWDLERLSEVCEERKQWSFFLTSAPLHVYGGVGTPPNIIAVL